MLAHSRPYRLPEHKKKVVQDELKAMLEFGVIEESHRDSASPIVLIPKTDGSVHFCVDYRKVNAESKFDAYPMPRVDELLDRLSISLLLFHTALNKRLLADPLVAITAFTMPYRLHQFIALSFGLLLPSWMTSLSTEMIGSGILNI